MTPTNRRVEAGRLLRPKRISRADIRANPNTLYVFGDNMARAGLGGQAREMRGEPNTIGIPTKWEPSRHQAAYFSDAAWNNERVRQRIFAAFDDIEQALHLGRDIAIPADGLGTGLAELPARAPLIHAYIEGRIAQLAAWNRRAPEPAKE